MMHVDIPLLWEPTSDLYDADTATLTGLYSRKIQIKAFMDSRENKKEIARNTESNETKLVTTRDDVAAWSRSRFEAIIKQYGFNVVEEKADVIIKGEILEFYVTEDSTYKANVGIKITAENAAGKVIWQGMITGKARRFGHSYDLENYYKTLSDAYLDAVNGLLKNEEFQIALQNKG
jgi:hypothetical protein